MYLESLISHLYEVQLVRIVLLWNEQPSNPPGNAKQEWITKGEYCRAGKDWRPKYCRITALPGAHITGDYATFFGGCKPTLFAVLYFKFSPAWPTHAHIVPTKQKLNSFILCVERKKTNQENRKIGMNALSTEGVVSEMKRNLSLHVIQLLCVFVAHADWRGRITALPGAQSPQHSWQRRWDILGLYQWPLSLLLPTFTHLSFQFVTCFCKTRNSDHVCGGRAAKPTLLQIMTFNMGSKLK